MNKVELLSTTALLASLLPLPTALAAIPCADGFESTVCSRHADNDAGKPPSYPDVGDELAFTRFGTSAVRLTEPGMFGDESLRHRHQYSRRQAWNADETLLDLNGGIVDADDASVVLVNPPISSERNWSNLDPRLIYAIRYNPDPNEFGVFSVETGEFETLHRFEQYEKCTIGEGEGNLSNDDRYVVLVCLDAQQVRTMISFDIEKGKVLGRLKARKDLNWASFTQTGEFIVVENNQPDTGLKEQLLRYTPDFRKETLLTDERSHGDLGIDQDGDDVFVMIHWKRLSYLVIATGKTVVLGVADRQNPIGHGHVSCRSIRRPGWCFLSSYDGALGAFRLGEQRSLWDRTKHLMKLQTDSSPGSAEFEQWGFHYSTSDSYDAQPKASVSPSGEQAIFTTDWGGTQEINDFVISPDKL